MNFTMHIFGLIWFAGMVSSSPKEQISITQTTTVVGFLPSELQSSTDIKLTTVLETSVIKDENNDEDCICTPFHKCKTYKASPDGNELIDIRINVAPCQSYLDVCCNDTKIASINKYKPSNPDTTDSNCGCVSPEDYNKETDIDHKDITKNPSDGHYEEYPKKSSERPKDEYTEKPYDVHKVDYTKDPHVGHNEEYTKKPSDGLKDEYTEKPYDVHKGDYTKDPHVGHNEEYTKKPSDGPKDEYTEKPYDVHKGDYTKDPPVNHNEEYTKKPSDGLKDEYTEKPYDVHKGDYTKDHHVSNNEEYTKKPYDGSKDEYTKKPYDGQSGYITKEPDHSYEVTEKSITHEHISTTESVITSYDHQEHYKCGVWNKYGVGFRIGNAMDSESQFGEFPSMVAIFKEELSKDGEKKLVLQCGGSLIKKDVILTAAHCVIKREISTLVVRAGEWDLKTEKEILNHQDRRVKKVVTHPDYYSGGLYNDIALIFTEHSFSLQDNIQLICLPSKDDIIIKDTCYSSGWGKTVSYNNYTIVKKTESGKTKETGQYQVSILKKVELPIVPLDKCMAALRATRLGPKFVLHDSFICAGGIEGRDTCKGDGGSPLLCPYKDEPDRLVQVGIVAWGIGCGLADVPGAYVNVVGFLHWINNEIEIRGY